MRTALVLSGGGARGAYQAGVLSGLAEIGLVPHGRSPFDVIVGSSAGSINAGMLAACAGDLASGVERLIDVWSTIQAHDVFRTDLQSLGSIGVRWAWDLSFGGALRRVQPKSLLDTAPLRALMARIPLSQIEANVQSGDPFNPFRWIDVLWLTPSVDFGSIAAELSDHVPPIVRYLLRGLGSDAAISELLSYLLFAPAFTRRLVEIGRTDALAAKAEILHFFAEAAGRGATRPSGTQRGPIGT